MGKLTSWKSLICFANWKGLQKSLIFVERFMLRMETLKARGNASVIHDLHLTNKTIKWFVRSESFSQTGRVNGSNGEMPEWSNGIR